MFRLSPKTDGNPRLSFKPGDRVHTGLVTGSDLNFAKASGSRIEDYRVDEQRQEASIYLFTYNGILLYVLFYNLS